MATRLFGSQTSLREANRANLLASIHKFGAIAGGAFNFIDQTGKLAGFHVDLVREICRA